MRDIKKLLAFVLCVVFVLLSLCSCKAEKSASDEMFALDTIITFKIYDSDKDKAENTISLLKDTITRLESSLSATKKGSDVYNINHSSGEKVYVSEATATLIKTACEISESCGGAFDISVYPLVKLWGFDKKEYKVPTQSEISDVLADVNFRNITIEDNSVTVKKGMSIDLGAIAKGYISNCVYDVMKSEKIERGIVNLGGMVVTYNSDESQSDWEIGVEYPDTGELFGKLSGKYTFTVTSGAYQRYFEENGVRYHHIIDPKTGSPAQSDISSVTVLGDDGTYCDALSTALFVMGVEDSLKYLKTHSDESGNMHSFIILNSNKDKLYISSDLADGEFTLYDDFEDEISVSVIDTMFV